jgi:serine/threonine-protein kinase RsbW
MSDGLEPLKEIVVANELEATKTPEKLILDEAARCGHCENAAFAVKLAFEEAMTNAYRHGNKCNPSKRIFIRYQVTKDKIEIEVRDEGEGFEPHRVPDPTQPEFIDRPHGRGIMLMRAYLDEVEFSQVGNAVRLVKLRE